MARRKIDSPRGVLKTAVGDPGRYQHARYHPSPDLAPYIEHYWSVRWDLRGCAPERAETLPHPSVHMIFERNVSKGRTDARVAGVARGKFSRLLSGQGSVIAAKFKPGGFHPFVGVDICTFSNKVVDIADVFDRSGKVAARSILCKEDDESRVTALEDFLRGREPAEDVHVARVAEIVYAVAGDRSILKVEDLVERYGSNARAIQRLFAKYVGATPKWVIQRYRLHEAAEQLALPVPVSHADLAIALGYSDQAHFNRDFKAIVGTPPAAYARRARSILTS